MYVAKFLGKYKDIYFGKNKNGYVFGRGESMILQWVITYQRH